MVPIGARKVRVMAKLRGSLAKEAESSKEGSVSWLSVYKPKGEDFETVTLTLMEQSLRNFIRRECYEVDFCYEKNQGNDVIYSREVKPLISRGTEEELDIAVLAMVEVLSVAEEKGKLVSMSFYEIVQDRVYDLLDQKQQEVSILEAHGKIQLKGLSQSPSRSRTLKGLIIYISSVVKRNDVVVGKMNFVDLAGYEDPRRKSRDGQTCVENIKMINKSIYALQNVVYSLKANEVHVPYRESKLTLLQGSLGGTSMTRLQAASFDSLYMLSLASRCGQGTSRAISDSTKKLVGRSKYMASASHKMGYMKVVQHFKETSYGQHAISEKKIATNGFCYSPPETHFSSIKTIDFCTLLSTFSTTSSYLLFHQSLKMTSITVLKLIEIELDEESVYCGLAKEAMAQRRRGNDSCLDEDEENHPFKGSLTIKLSSSIFLATTNHNSPVTMALSAGSNTLLVEFSIGISSQLMISVSKSNSLIDSSKRIIQLWIYLYREQSPIKPFILRASCMPDILEPSLMVKRSLEGVLLKSLIG
ncbi:hypothetical protein K2173_028550 [Erythroxylum novogranatense]|uniref:Kinesin motor domain-containing protein n=1 Tax=Erythroxylum novogranatense TaxID=1862640 RepID=A0AAV8U6A3_9ROSI|nr:hypothetical protein K2173_028550 [Erythroxylum novogranatense]